MARSTNPTITAERLKSMKPMDIITLHNIDLKKLSCISSMIGYIKDFCLPKSIAGYSYSYNKTEQICRICAFGRGDNLQKIKRALRKIKTHDNRTRQTDDSRDSDGSREDNEGKLT